MPPREPEVDTSQGPLEAVRQFFTGIFSKKTGDEAVKANKERVGFIHKNLEGQFQQFIDVNKALVSQGIDPATVPGLRQRAEQFRATDVLSSFSQIANQFSPQRTAREAAQEIVNRPVPITQGGEGTPVFDLPQGVRTPENITSSLAGQARPPTSEEKLARTERVASDFPAAFGTATGDASLGQLALQGKRQKALLSKEVEKAEFDIKHTQQLLANSKIEQQRLEQAAELERQKLANFPEDRALEIDVKRQQIAASKAQIQADIARANAAQQQIGLGYAQLRQNELQGLVNTIAATNASPAQVTAIYQQAKEIMAGKRQEYEGLAAQGFGNAKQAAQARTLFIKESGDIASEVEKMILNIKASINKGDLKETDLAQAVTKANQRLGQLAQRTLAAGGLRPEELEADLLQSVQLVVGRDVFTLEQAIGPDGPAVKDPKLLNQLPPEIRSLITNVERKARANELATRLTGPSAPAAPSARFGGTIPAEQLQQEREERMKRQTPTGPLFPGPQPQATTNPGRFRR